MSMSLVSLDGRHFDLRAPVADHQRVRRAVHLHDVYLLPRLETLPRPCRSSPRRIRAGKACRAGRGGGHGRRCGACRWRRPAGPARRVPRWPRARRSVDGGRRRAVHGLRVPGDEAGSRRNQENRAEARGGMIHTKRFGPPPPGGRVRRGRRHFPTLFPVVGQAARHHRKTLFVLRVRVDLARAVDLAGESRVAAIADLARTVDLHLERRRWR